MRVDGDHRGTDLSKPAPAVGEEVPERDLHSRLGCLVPVARSTNVRQWSEWVVSQMWVIVPGPSIVAIGKVVPAPMITDGDSFQPSPRSRAA